MVAGLDEVLAQLARTIRHAAAGIAPVAALVFLAACDPGTAKPADSAGPVPVPVVDSILPPEEALRRFRAGLDSVAVLDGPGTRAELLRRFRLATNARDTAALAALAIRKDEFAFLIYPESRLSRPPYRQPPEIAWMMLRHASEAGLRKLLARAPTMQVLGVACPDSIDTEGAMRTVRGCLARVQSPDNVRDVRLFGRIVELNGRWKIVGYDGDL